MVGQPSLLDRPLIVVTGKGGAGKTTVAAALGVLAARSGRRTIVCEVAGQRRIPDVLGHHASSAFGAEEPLEPGLWATTISPEGTLVEWAGRFVRPRALVELAVRSRALSGFVAAAPGARELMAITKAWELGAEHRWAPERRRYDLVVLDAPASGHGLGMLGTPQTFAEIARVGPIAAQARVVAAALRDPRHTAIVAVAALEETPVDETLELQDRVALQLGQGPAAIVANGVLRDPLSRTDRDLVAGSGDVIARPVAAALRSRRARSRAHAAQLRRLRRGARAPVLTLPWLGGPVDADGVERLAGDLRRRLEPLAAAG